MQKNFVLDANILIHDPGSIFQFEDNTVIIPVSVIEEIDRFKKERTDRGFNARAIARLLDSLRVERRLTEGVPVNNGGTVKVYCEPERALHATTGNGDLEILRVATAIKQAEPETPVIIVTKDINLRIRADVSGLKAEDYETDRVKLSELAVEDVELQLTAEGLDDFRRSGEIILDDIAAASYHPNQHVLLRQEDNPKQSALGRIECEGKRIVRLTMPEEGLCGIRPRNKEQYYAIDALLDPEVQLVTLMGKAGTGKTLLAMAAAMHTVLVDRAYRSALVGRPIVPLGRDVGYLPGDIDRKLEPWMKPVVDTIDFLFDTGGSIRGHHTTDSLITSGIMEIQPLAYIRGRSISNRIVVIDEAQNLTPLEVKTVITRIGRDAKVVLTGDPYQIDNPYVDANSNGFTYLVNRFRPEGLAAHVTFHKGERSPLAELAANLL